MPISVYPKDKPVDVFNLTATEGDVALEMEVEGQNLPTLRNKLWTTHADGSLRLNGMEYVNNGPLAKNKVLESLLNWEARLIKSEAIVFDSERTSVHVHMNMQDKSFKQIIQGCVAYYALENALMRYCGPSRMTNLFCLPLKQGKGQMTAMKYLAGQFLGGNLRPDTYRYSALNLMALLKFGSVEHRGMRGHYDPQFLTDWSLGLKNIFDVAANDFKSPVEVLDHYYGRDYKSYAGTFLTDKMMDNITKMKDWDVDKTSNLSLLGSFVYETDFDAERPADKPAKKSTSPYISIDDAVRSYNTFTAGTGRRRSNPPQKSPRGTQYGQRLNENEMEELYNTLGEYEIYENQLEAHTNGIALYDEHEDEYLIPDHPGERPRSIRKFTFYVHEAAGHWDYADWPTSTLRAAVIGILGENSVNAIDRDLAAINSNGIDLVETVRMLVRDTLLMSDEETDRTTYYNLTTQRVYQTAATMTLDLLHFLDWEYDYRVRYRIWENQDRQAQRETITPDTTEADNLNELLRQAAQHVVTRNPIINTYTATHWADRVFNDDNDD